MIVAKSLTDKQARAKRKRLKKKGKSGIVIKPQNKGKFTRWCKANGFPGPNSRCIAKARKSSNASVRKMANFAASAKKFKK